MIINLYSTQRKPKTKMNPTNSFTILWFFLATISTSTRQQCDAFLFPVPPSKSKRATYPLLQVSANPSNVGTESPSNQNIDPLLSRILLQQDTAQNLQFDQVLAASTGIATWRHALLKGRLPDFDSEEQSIWPEEPLFTSLSNAMTELQLPRFVLRHPETVSAVLLSMLRMTTKYAKQSKVMLYQKEKEAQEDEEEDDEYEWWDSLLEDRWTNYDEDIEEVSDESQNQSSDEIFLSEEEQKRLAQNIINSGLIDQWGPVISGVQALDQLFGMNHDLLDIQDTGSVGFGLDDGIWRHSGWKLLPGLQQEITDMPELRDLIQMLGRRPTADESDSIQKFVPRKLDDQGPLGAQYDPSQRTSVRGITLTGSLSDMLPSEALLLAQGKSNRTDGGPSPSTLRRLFLAKMAESKLLSYESSGWQDVPSSPISKPRYLSRLPSAPGGPILICLDTSFSMTGRREQLSKALVLACVAAAHKQKRDIQVIAFSSAQNTMETGPISADQEGVQRLLEFLSSSFGGGTDVTGALKHAMGLISNELQDKNEPRKDSLAGGIDHMAAADILLVTDGEIPDPPVSDEVMESLRRLKQRSGVQVHGLLIGKRESVPLSKLCTHIHDFLLRYDSFIPNVGSNDGTWFPRNSATALFFCASNLPTIRHRGHLHGWACQQIVGTFHRSHSLSEAFSLSAKKRSGKKRSQYGDEDGGSFLVEDDYYDYEEGSESGEVQTTASNGYFKQTEKMIATLRKSASSLVQEQRWKTYNLDDEKASETSCWRYRSELQFAVEKVAEGLVEREEEARLVVLGMVSREHLLFLGPPGTAKSVLGRRLSQICGGAFFQRLLTRFTTPKEIFGPLSLRALENDEYRRKTDGFLPTASVAFLDEIFKANSAILNTLLTILNERQFDNGAGLRENCPIRCVVGASNELPESDELDALYDRFLIRKEVLPVSDTGLIRMLGMPQLGNSLCSVDSSTGPSGESSACDTVFSDDLDQIIRSISIAADIVEMDGNALELMRDLRTFMREEINVEVSDRRLVKATRLLKISAACHGRSKVDPLDCLLLQHVMWRLPEERGPLREWLWNHITPGSSGMTMQDETLESAAKSFVRQFRLLLDGLREEATQSLRVTMGDVTGENGGRAADIAVIKSVLEEASRIGNILQKRANDLSRHQELLRRCQDHLWLDPDEASAAKQLLLPRAEAYLAQVERALEDTHTLKEALTDKPGPVTNELRLDVVESLWESDDCNTVEFSEEALNISMKEAKAKYDIETFRKWKKAYKKLNG